jgi:hypothetical protein
MIEVLEPLIIPKSYIRSRFLRIKDNLDLVTYSLFRSKDLDLVDEIYLRIREDRSTFADVAYLSDGPESQTQGIVGPCPISRAHPDISIHLRSLQIGALKKPFWFNHWSVILRVEERIGARYPDWEEKIEEQLKMEMTVPVKEVAQNPL